MAASPAYADLAAIRLVDPSVRQAARWAAVERIKPNRERTRLLVHAHAAVVALLHDLRGDVVDEQMAADMLLALAAGAQCPGVGVLVAPMRFVLASLAHEPPECGVVLPEGHS